MVLILNSTHVELRESGLRDFVNLQQLASYDTISPLSLAAVQKGMPLVSSVSQVPNI